MSIDHDLVLDSKLSDGCISAGKTALSGIEGLEAIIKSLEEEQEQLKEWIKYGAYSAK